MKKLIPIVVLLIFAGFTNSFGQKEGSPDQKGKKDQAELFNNFYASYGVGSVFYFVKNESASADNSTWTFQVGYSRSLVKVIAVGMVLSYTHFDRSKDSWGYYSDQGSVKTRIKMDDNAWQGIANVRFQYLNRRSFCMYSGIGIGVTMDTYSQTNQSTGEVVNGQKLLPAGQMTLLGFRAGRALGVFGEFGIGTNSIINLGISYKFGDD